MQTKIINISSWEFIKGILNVWWVMLKEFWYLWLILAVVLAIEVGFKCLGKWIKNKRKK